MPQNVDFSDSLNHNQKASDASDELEAKLNQSQAYGAKLMEAVVAGLVGA